MRSKLTNTAIIRLAVWVLAMLAPFLSGCKPGQAGGPPPDRVVQVVLATAANQSIDESLSLIGTVLADEMVEIQSETDGMVASIHFKEGEAVEAGELLIKLDESKLAALLALAESNFKLGLANYERNQQLFKDHLISQQEFDQVSAVFEAHQASLDLRKREYQDTRIHAPFSGVVGARQVSPGQVISKSTPLTWLVALDSVKVEINVPERFLGRLQIDQTIAIKVAAHPGRAFVGRVYFIAPFVNPDTRTALVKAQIPNPDHALLPGMFASLELTLETRANAVVIPEEAIAKLNADDTAMIYVVDDASLAQMRTVKIGVRLPGKVEIVDGLKGEERVVVEGLQKLAPGVQVITAGATDKDGS